MDNTDEAARIVKSMCDLETLCCGHCIRQCHGRDYECTLAMAILARKMEVLDADNG